MLNFYYNLLAMSDDDDDDDDEIRSSINSIEPRVGVASEPASKSVFSSEISISL